MRRWDAANLSRVRGEGQLCINRGLRGLCLDYVIMLPPKFVKLLVTTAKCAVVIKNVALQFPSAHFSCFFISFFHPDNTRAKSDEFAERNGLPKYEFVLHPRTTGFTFIVDTLRKGPIFSVFQ